MLKQLLFEYKKDREDEVSDKSERNSLNSNFNLFANYQNNNNCHTNQNILQGQQAKKTSPHPHPQPNLSLFLEFFNQNFILMKPELDLQNLEKRLQSFQNHQERMHFFFTIISNLQNNVKNYYLQIKNNQFILNQLLDLASNLSREVTGITILIYINYFNYVNSCKYI